jgi:hypothetical protein
VFWSVEKVQILKDKRYDVSSVADPNPRSEIRIQDPVLFDPGSGIEKNPDPG